MKLKTPVSNRDHAIGSPDAPVTLVEYGDYQCPYCGRALDDDALLSGAAGVGLDVDASAGSLSEGTYRARVRDDFMSGVKSGVNGTPTLYINGIRHDADYDLQTLLAAIEQARLAVVAG